RSRRLRRRGEEGWNQLRPSTPSLFGSPSSSGAGQRGGGGGANAAATWGAVMAPKPRTAKGYNRTDVGYVKATCLYLATKLGALLDEVVIVGGWVPALLIDQRAAAERHVGTADLDVGLSLAIFDNKRYQALTERLRSAGFTPDENEKGNRTPQRWRIEG